MGHLITDRMLTDKIKRAGFSCLLFLLAACHQSSDSNNNVETEESVETEPQSYQVSATVLGLSGELSLQSGNELIDVSANGDVLLEADIAEGTSYDIQVSTQPDNQFCEVANGQGVVASNINNIQVNCNKLHYFVATDSSYYVADNYELWATNGTEEGTYLVKDINPSGSSMILDDGQSATSINVFLEFQNAYYFEANNGSLGRELWKTDGSEAGTVLVADINDGVGNGSSNPNPLFNIGDKLVLNAFNSETGYTQSHVMDADDNITTLSLVTLSGSGRNIVHDETLIFAGWSSVHGNTVIHNTDGDIVEVMAFNGAVVDTPYTLNIAGNNLFYFRPNGIGSISLWVTNADGSSSPEKLADFTAMNSALVANEISMQIAVIGNQLFFNANDGIYGHTLWASDGTIAGTYMVKDLDGSSSDSEVIGLLALDEKILFHVESDVDSIDGVWVSDGTEDGTIQLLNQTTAMSSGIAGDLGSSSPVVANGLYFFTSESSVGYELWATDGSVAGTYLVKDIYPGELSSSPRLLEARTGYILFSAESSQAEGRELWRSDGTEEGTYLIKDICTDDSCSGYRPIPFS